MNTCHDNEGQFCSGGSGGAVKIAGPSSRVSSYLSGVPKDHLIGLDRVEVMTGQKIAEFAQSQGGFRFGITDDVRAAYVNFPGKMPYIILRPDSTKEDFLHELGHHVWNKLSSVQQAQYNKAPGVYYGGTKRTRSTEERFSEFYTLLSTGKRIPYSGTAQTRKYATEDRRSYQQGVIGMSSVKAALQAAKLSVPKSKWADTL